MRGISRTRSLPAVGKLIQQDAYAELQRRYPRGLVVEAIRAELAGEREHGETDDETRLRRVQRELDELSRPRLRRVINATGVVLHTNLGRAPLSRDAATAAQEIARGYSNLELDLESGRRGERASVVEPLLKAITAAEAGFAVNNNAGAVLLALTALCRGREVIVSRGQQVEIGGAFRMPDVMRLSGARMVEVGTTNRTRAGDYGDAVTARTAAILRVHTSNFRITGFTESAGLDELATIARAHDLLLIDDLGSGAVEPMADEPAVADSVAKCDVVLFSGDKLLGGPQAGIAVGHLEPLARMRRHPLARALRIDKMSLAALEVTLRERLLQSGTAPVSRMLRADREQLSRRVRMWKVKLEERGVAARLVDGSSAVGGGSLPGHDLPTVLLQVEGPASRLASALRRGSPAVMARVEADHCSLDPRTVLQGEDEELIDAVEAAVATLRRDRA